MKWFSKQYLSTCEHNLLQEENTYLDLLTIKRNLSWGSSACIYAAFEMNEITMQAWDIKESITQRKEDT